jgi:Golgi SNAP receptor complex protein 1
VWWKQASGSLSPGPSLLRERGAIHGNILQVDEVINQAQATKGALAAQRSAFMEIQGKLKQLADRFPVVRGLLGKLFGKKLAHALSLLQPYKNLVHGKLIYISKQFC